MWLPALASVGLSFTSWDGIGGLGTIKWVGISNYDQIFTIYPPFWPALRHNLIWLAFFLRAADDVRAVPRRPAGQADPRLRLYQSMLYPAGGALAGLVGFIGQLSTRRTRASSTASLGRTEQGNVIDWLGDPRLNLWAVLVAAAWRHAGYIMVLYLAGLKSVDPSLREAAAIDGASEWQAFRTVIFPALRPINIVVLVVTVIEALRAFDIVYVINGGRNGLELLSVLVYDNIVGEASRIGYGSAIGVILLVISLGSIITYLVHELRERGVTVARTRRRCASERGAGAPAAGRPARLPGGHRAAVAVPAAVDALHVAAAVRGHRRARLRLAAAAR